MRRALLVLLCATSAFASDSATIVRVSGPVEVFGPAGSSAQAARKGARLAPGDRLRVGPGGKADLLVEGKLQTIAGGQEFTFQAAPKPWLGALMAELAGLASSTEEATAPGASRHTTGTLKILSPLDTALPGAPATLRWEPLSAAPEGYVVVVRDSLGAEKLRQDCSGAELALPAGAWKPEPGARYSWTVQPRSVAGSLPSESWFQVLDAKDSSELSARLTSLQQSMPSAEDSVKLLVAKALVYREFRCFREARELLSQAAEQGKGSQWTRAARRCMSSIGEAR